MVTLPNGKRAITVDIHKINEAQSQLSFGDYAGELHTANKLPERFIALYQAEEYARDRENLAWTRALNLALRAARGDQEAIRQIMEEIEKCKGQ